MEAKFGETEIKSLLQKLRIFNKAIGEYQLFAITESFEYVVKVTNGSILLRVEELQDDIQDALVPDQLSAIAGRFIPSSSQKANPEIVEKPILQTQSLKEPKKNLRKTFRTVLIIVFGVIVIGGGAFVLYLIGSGQKDFEGVFEGKLQGGQELYMKITSENRKISGSYFDKVTLRSAKVKGQIKRLTNITLTEFDDLGNISGIFTGMFKDPNRIEGTWSVPDGSQKYPFTLNKVDLSYEKLYNDIKLEINQKDEENRIREKKNEEAANLDFFIANLNNNISKYLVVSNNKFQYRDVGGVFNLEISLYNDTPYWFDIVVVKVDYLSKNGEIVNTAQIVFQDIEPQRIVRKKLEDSKRGVTISTSITKATSTFIKYDYNGPKKVEF